MKTDIGGDPIGACPVCGLQYMGCTHNCPGEIHHVPPSAVVGAQFIDEMDGVPYRPYGQRLAEGFELLADSGWDVELPADSNWERHITAAF